MASREAKSKRARREAGLCAGCGALSAKYRCPACARLEREGQRRRSGSKKKKQRGPGRPTLY